MKQTNDIYENPELYDQISAGDGADLTYFIERALELQGPILELGCGTGRILNPLAAMGFDCTGVDLSSQMIERARDKAKDLNVQVDYVVADMKQFKSSKKFKLVYIAMNSLLHLHHRESFEQLFSAVRSYLAEGGQLVVSVFNPSPAILNRNPQERFLVGNFRASEGQGKVKVEETTAYDQTTQILSTHWYYSDDERKDFYEHTFHLRVLYPQETRMLLHYNGFEIASLFGNYGRKKFESGDRLQILSAVLRKKPTS